MNVFFFRCSGLTSADCPYRLSAVEMKFHAQLQKTTDSVGREYLPPHIAQYMEWGRVCMFLKFLNSLSLLYFYEKIIFRTHASY